MYPCGPLFKDVPDLLACLDATPPEKLYVSRIFDRTPLFATNFSGPVTLNGDALHAVTPTYGGANLALEDAFTLAGRPPHAHVSVRKFEKLRVKSRKFTRKFQNFWKI